MSRPTFLYAYASTDCLRIAHPPPTIESFSTQFIFISSGSRIHDLLKGGGKNFFAIFNFSVRRRGDKFKVIQWY